MEYSTPSSTRTLMVLLGLLSAIFWLYSLAISYRARQAYISSNRCREPNAYPHRDPILGLDFLRDSIRAGKDFKYLAREQELHTIYGNTFSSRFFRTTVFNTVEPENLKTILSTKFPDYGVGARRKNAFAPLLGDSIFQRDGARWEASRALLRPCFQRAQTEGTAIFEPHVSNLLRAIPRNGETVDLALLFHRLAADWATDFLFGESIKSLDDPDKLTSGVLKAIHDSQSGCEFRWLVGSLSSIIPQPAFFRNVGIVHEFIQRHVDKALEYRKTLAAPPVLNLEEVSTRQVFLEQLAERTQDRKVLQDELLTLYFAGSDAVSALLMNMVFAISKHPNIWQRLREEVRPLNGQAPTTQQLKKLRYVNNCVSESLRLHPVQPSNSRVAYQDTILPLGGGSDGLAPLFVPKGTMIHFSIYTIHRRPDLWGADADEFRPERWEHEKQSWNFIPFLGGPRNCIGQDFAMQEAAYTLVRLVQEFKTIESRDPGPWIEGLSLACMSKNGAKVAMKAAESFD